MMMVTQLGIVMMVPIFLCGALGVWLNRLTGIDIIFPGFACAWHRLRI